MASAGSDGERLRRAIESELRAAAAARWEAPFEPFLWRSRRCVEAMLYALIQENKGDVASLAASRKSLDDLLKHEKLKGALPTGESLDHLGSLQKYGNTGTHFQPDGDVSEMSANVVASALAGLSRWFYARPGASPPPDLARLLTALVDRSQRLRSAHEVALEEERARTRDLEVRLAGTHAPVAPAAWGARQALAGVALALLGVALGAAPWDRVFDTDAVASSGALVSPPRSRPTATPPSTLPPSPVPTVLAAPPSAPPTTATTAPSWELERGTVTARDCQARGLLLVPEGASGDAFCIASAPVTTREYRDCVDRGNCPRPSALGEGCNWSNGRGFDGNAANCVSWEAAGLYCATRYPRGSLPSRADWTRAAGRSVPTMHPPGTREWSADGGPGARLVRAGRRSSPRWAPVRDEGGTRDLSFRCVSR